MSLYSDYFLNSKSNVVQLETLEISHPNFSKVYRIVRNATGGITPFLEDGSNPTFDYYPLRIRPTTSRDNLDTGLNVDLGDLGEIIPQELEYVMAGFVQGPVITLFTTGAITDYTVNITALTAFGLINPVTGFAVTSSSVPPVSWSNNPPPTFIFPNTIDPEDFTLYGWAQDSNGIVSQPATRSVFVIGLLGYADSNVTAAIFTGLANLINALPGQLDAPVLTSFTLGTVTDYTVLVMSLTATAGTYPVAGYAITETSSTPVAWSGGAPTSYVFSPRDPGTFDLYGWAHDSQAHVSNTISQSVFVAGLLGYANSNIEASVLAGFTPVFNALPS